MTKESFMSMEAFDRELAIGEIMEITELSRDEVLDKSEKVQELIGFKELEDGIAFILAGVRRGDQILS